MKPFLKKTFFCLAATMAVLLSVSCGDTENEYEQGVTYFVFDNSTHQDATLASCMNSASPGAFCTITMSGTGGATTFNFSSNQGLSSSQTANAIDLRRTCVLGYNNGIIVGFGNLDYPAVFYAYDRECPNCYSPSNLQFKSRPITVSQDGIGTCSACKRKYNLNTGGNIVSEESEERGSALTRYRASTTGGYGVLSVN